MDAQLRLHWQPELKFLGRDVMLPSVMASDPAHDPNTFPVEALKKPHVLSTYNPAFRAMDTALSSESTMPVGRLGVYGLILGRRVACR